jgi:hypothetical protein
MNKWEGSEDSSVDQLNLRMIVGLLKIEATKGGDRSSTIIVPIKQITGAKLQKNLKKGDKI